jgi:hypothetical protein
MSLRQPIEIHTTMTSQFFSPCFTDFHSSLFPISPFIFSVWSSSVNVHLVLCCVYTLHLSSQLSPLLKNCDLCEHPVTNTELSDTTVLLLYCLSLRLFFVIRFLLCGLPSLLTFHPFINVNVIKVPKCPVVLWHYVPIHYRSVTHLMLLNLYCSYLSTLRLVFNKPVILND